jgi:hypothetical protein
MVAPAEFTSEVALSVRPAETLIPVTLVELLVSVVMPLKSPPVTPSCAVPCW